MNPNEAGISKIEQARRFWANCWMTINHIDSNMTFRIRKDAEKSPANVLFKVDYLYDVADRLRGVQIDNMDALMFIQKYAKDDNALIYCDPPYMQETRSKKNGYKFETNDKFHSDLAELLNTVPGKKIVSGYANDTYRELYDDKGWRRIDFKVLANSGQNRIESLWLSPNIKTSKSKHTDTHNQANLFDLLP